MLNNENILQVCCVNSTYTQSLLSWINLTRVVSVDLPLGNRNTNTNEHLQRLIGAPKHNTVEKQRLTAGVKHT